MKKIDFQQPEGFAVAGKEKQACRQKQTQLPLWAQTSLKGVECHFDTFLIKFGLCPSDADPCLYLCHH